MCSRPARRAGPADWAHQRSLWPRAWVHLHNSQPLCPVLNPAGIASAAPLLPDPPPPIGPELTGVWIDGTRIPDHRKQCIEIVRAAVSQGLTLTAAGRTELAALARQPGEDPPEKLIDYVERALDYLNRLCTPGVWFEVDEGLIVATDRPILGPIV